MFSQSIIACVCIVYLSVVHGQTAFYITSYVGTAGNPNTQGDNGPYSSGGLNAPQGVWGDPTGNIYIGEITGKRIRKVTASTGILSTFGGMAVVFSGKHAYYS